MPFQKGRLSSHSSAVARARAFEWKGEVRARACAVSAVQPERAALASCLRASDGGGGNKRVSAAELESRPPIGSGLLNPPSPQGRRGPSLGCPPTHRGPLQQLSHPPHRREEAEEEKRLDEDDQEQRGEQQQRRGWWWWCQWLCLAGCADASSHHSQQAQKEYEREGARRTTLSSAFTVFNQDPNPHDSPNRIGRPAAAAATTAAAAPIPDTGGAGGTGRGRDEGGGGGAMAASPSPTSHCFAKRTFHKPVSCHHCTDLLWGIIGQGFTCEVCNFVCHDKCMKVVVSPCSSVAPTLVKTPVAHCWSEPAHHRRKFCNVCRKRLDDTWTIRCEVCEYYVHVECSDFSVANCKDSATFNPQQTLETVEQKHHWREGNLPQNSKCAADKKTCWAAECLAGLRCEWCGTTAHVGCVDKISPRCTFGVLEPILLPPSAVSIPRTEVPMEAIIGLSVRRKDTLSPRSISEEFSSGDFKAKEAAEEAPKEKSKEKEEKDEEVVKVFDGNSSLRRRMFRLVSLSRSATSKEFLHAAARAFHVPQEAHRCYLTDAYSDTEEEVLDPLPLSKLTRKEGKRPAVFLRFREKDNLEGLVNVYLGKVGRRVEKDKIELPVTSETRVSGVIRTSLYAFGLYDENPDDFRLVEVILDKGVCERIMETNEQPWERLKAVARDSIRQMEMTRFYLQQKKDPHGTSIALFVGNLPPNLSQRQYETILTDILGKGYKFSSIGPIYYEYGSMVLTYEDTDTGVRSFYTLRESSYEDKALLAMLLPNIFPEMVAEGVQPLLVFVNVKSGGCQGLELVSSFRKLLNPYQVFDLENGGPLPGLYVFRNMKDYKILVCGGDGTIGWVLQCLDNVGQDSECSSPPCAIVPLGTGNDLARVLRWGPGYTGGEDPLNLLKDVIEAEEIRLDRWTVVFRMEDKAEEKMMVPNSTAAAATSEENTQIFVMNNYFGIGIEAELCLDFHNAREENPNKFNSRLHNKGVYVKMGLRKMVSRKLCKDLHKEIRLEVDGKLVELPPLEGIVILNILSWGSGANPWGLEKDDHFSKPNHWDGMLEVVGVTGVVHLGQIQSGLRSAMRIAQGGHIRIKLNSEIPIQVDGEPWIQAPGEVVVLKSALKATMLKKTTRSRLHRRNTEPFATRSAPAPVIKEKTQA